MISKLKEKKSVMNYEEKYKQAIERAKRMFSEKELNYLFPELKESEDERIRKELIFYLGDMPEDTELRNGVTNRDVLVWLEKQGKNVEKKFREGDKVVSNQDGKVYTVGTEYSIRGDNICLYYPDGYHKWTNRDDLDKNYHLWTSEETDPCIGCTNDKGCVTCENGNPKETKAEPKFREGDWITDVKHYFILQILKLIMGMS